MFKKILINKNSIFHKTKAAFSKQMDFKPEEMEYRYLGPSGLKVSALSYGNWLTSNDKALEESTIECVKRCYEYGVNFFDTAEIYGEPYGLAEIVMGKAIKALNVPREKLVISTKILKGGTGVNEVGQSRKHIIEGINNSLKRLGLDYVDVIFCHRPDLFTPVEETCRAMNWVIENGKAFYWGTSEHSAAEIEKIHACCDKLGLIKPIVEQPQYNMLHRERFEAEYGVLFDKYGLGSTIWSPLAGGLLTGKYNAGVESGSRYSQSGTGSSYEKFMGTEEKRKSTVAKFEALAEIAKELDCTLAQLALAWCLVNKNVSTAMFGASKISQIDDNVKALRIYKQITPQIGERIEKILDNRPETEMDYRAWKPSEPRR